MLVTRNPDTVAAPGGLYSHSVEIPPNARWLVLAGQVGVKPDGTMADGIEAQDEQIWKNVVAILDIGYDAEGSDFGSPNPQRAFFEDFREVDGVIIPHFIEKQWYTRDRIMEELAGVHPDYGWERNLGYGTPEHRAALIRLGVTPHHRRSFRPIHNILCGKHNLLH